MNKQEIEHKLEQAKKDRATICKGFTEEIGNLQAQLTEADKLKRRHGDFGFDNKNCPCLIIQKAAGLKHELAVASSTYTYGNDSGLAYVPVITLGNIFDLLKEWSEDLEEFEFDVHNCKINTVDFPHAPIHFAGNCHTLSEIEEIWHNLGRVIATLKRKQS